MAPAFELDVPQARGQLHIDSLRLRVPARDAGEGRRLALELLDGLARGELGALDATAQGATLGTLKLSVKAPLHGSRGSLQRSLSSSLSRAIDRGLIRKGSDK